MALEEVGRSQAELARDKAALVVQLTASERENAMLSEELAAFRHVWFQTWLISQKCSAHVCVSCGCNLQVGARVPGDQPVRSAAAARSGGNSQRAAGDREPNPQSPL